MNCRVMNRRAAYKPPRRIACIQRCCTVRMRAYPCWSPSDPSRQARNASFRGSAELAGLPVSAVGLTTRLAGEPKGALGIVRSVTFLQAGGSSKHQAVCSDDGWHHVISQPAGNSTFQYLPHLYSQHGRRRISGAPAPLFQWHAVLPALKPFKLTDTGPGQAPRPLP